MARRNYKYDGNRCYFCGITFNSTGENSRKTTDHLIPRSKGGPNAGDNIVVACYLCNHKKGDKDLEEFETSEWLFNRRVEILRRELKLLRKAQRYSHKDLSFHEKGWTCQTCTRSGQHGESPTLIPCN